MLSVLVPGPAAVRRHVVLGTVADQAQHGRGGVGLGCDPRVQCLGDGVRQALQVRTARAVAAGRTGRPVTLAVGEHVRACRTYRGRDLQWWMDATGLNDERYDEVENLSRARNLASFQLAATRIAGTST